MGSKYGQAWQTLAVVVLAWQFVRKAPMPLAGAAESRGRHSWSVDLFYLSQIKVSCQLLKTSKFPIKNGFLFFFF